MTDGEMDEAKNGVNWRCSGARKAKCFGGCVHMFDAVRRGETAAILLEKLVQFPPDSKGLVQVSTGEHPGLIWPYASNSGRQKRACTRSERC